MAAVRTLAPELAATGVVHGACAQLLGGSADGLADDSRAPACWWVAHTRARNEKRLAEVLLRDHVSYFLPLIHRAARRGRHAANLPLFPGYVFLWGDESARRAARASNRVASVLSVPDQTRLAHELRQIYRAVLGPAPVDLYPALRVGQRCRIGAGPLRGVEGIVDRRDLSRVFLAATFLGQSAVIEVDTSEVELLD
jgi:transcriptional antiterminator RfaH